MTTLDQYLAQHYLNLPAFASACAISSEKLQALIAAQLVPACSYRVNSNGSISSYVFGEMAAAGALSGEYFHPELVGWVARARNRLASLGAAAAYLSLKAEFVENFSAALAELNRNIWRLPDSFDDAGRALSSGLEARYELIWQHFLLGTIGLCVRHPLTEAAIAHKEVLQEKLSALSDNGAKSIFTDAEAQELLALITAYADATMPFSPIEFPISSRKRLVDDLRLKIEHAQKP
jgi:hypothetical protein